MANQDRASGLSPVQYLNGSPWNGGGRVYCIPNTDDTNAYAIGDPVVLAGDADAQGVPTITLATAGSASSVLGPIVSGAGATIYGGAYGVPQESPIVIPAVKSRDYYVLVCDDPNVIFEIQEEDLGTAFTSAEVGLNANLSSGTNNGYVSGWEVDTASPGAGGTLQLKLLGLAQKVNGNAFGDWAKWLVLINLHCYRIGQVGY
jgi:hypothetical protein